MLGKTVGKYRILERLGRGGMGIVYKALDETLDREVAIKVLNPDLGEGEVLKRFRAEAISLARLNHPGIATIYELYRHEDDLLMVMEFVRGETLQTLSERLGPLAPPQAAHLCIQVLDALAHAHRAGIVHRDLKPANVMVTDTGLVKVMDFGIARMLGSEHYTHTGYMMGTPAYMAPEQVLGQTIDRRADLYSVGVLFYRLLTRELPFQADTAIAMAQKQVAEPPTPLGTFRADLPPWCEDVIIKALAKSRDARFQTAEEFRAAILAAVSPVTLGELPTMATPTSANLLRTADVSIAPAPGPDSSAPTPVSGTAPRPSVERTGTTVVLGRGHLFTLAAVLVLLLLGMVALGIAVLKRGAGAREGSTSPPAAPPAADVSTAPNPESGTDQQQPAAPVPTVARETPPVAPPAATTPPRAAKPTTDTAPPPKAKAATGRADEPPRTVRADEPPPIEPAAPPPPVVTAPALPPLTFKDVKMLVPEGKTRREREAVLTLAGDHLALLDDSTKTELLSLPYSSIAQAFYSRSKQPKWKGPDGKDVSIPVNLGRMGFFRGERNWVIFTTPADPVFIAFDDRELSAALRAIQERTRVRIQR